MPACPLALLVALAAQADIAPPRGYVETCTVERQQEPGSTCLSCSTTFREPDACATRHAQDGYTHRCRTDGASTWSEVWCRPAVPQDTLPPAPPTDPSVIPEVVPPVPASPPEAAVPDPARCGVGAAATLAGIALGAGLAMARRRRG